MDIRRAIQRRIRPESPNASVVADVSEERRAGQTPPKRVEDVRQDRSVRAAPIDEDVAGELNAALPEEESEDGSDGAGGSKAA